ncbi:FAD-dependent oxidoreductase [Nocardia vinacea]|uniref:FAD-dependent oxidoreductase n=1 Tax=Nocardia vinacea TaxID=96468 RepID=A0ABZ1YY42_9NOCA|nr:FAD-dependent oxidoreductase [Nocardia vinacea]
MRPIVIVGGSVSGVRCMQSLRGRGYTGEIVMIEREEFSPYDKPPLTKAMLAEGSPSDPPPLLTQEVLAGLQVDLRLGTTAVAQDLTASTVTLDTGEVLEYSNLVIATGLVPRTLPGAQGLQGVFTVRGAADSLALKRELENSKRALVIGGGFIGAEFAAAARLRGIDVTIVEMQDQPLAHLLGPTVGARFAEFHRRRGTTVLTGSLVTGFLGEGRVSAVELSDGRTLDADTVVIGIGAAPAVDWLKSSGLPLSDGVSCDQDLRVVGTSNVYAAGDIARWPHGLYGEDMRIEHWTNANEHGDLVAAAILDQNRPTAQVPYVWSDQYERRIQIVGRPKIGRLATLIGEDDLEQWAAIYADDADVVVGAVAMSNPRLIMKCRRAIAQRAALETVL